MLISNLKKNINSFSRQVANKNYLLRTFSEITLRKTPLWNLHKELQAKTTEFSGWDMPLCYKEGIIKEHLHCRSNAGLFDVSHMLGVIIKGKERIAFAETIFPANIQELKVGEGTLTNLTNEGGGLIDDCIITNMGDYLYLVINAGHENKDLPHMNKYSKIFSGNVEIIPQIGNGLLALQGPRAAQVLSKLLDNEKDNLQNWNFMSMRSTKVAGINCLVSRSGYTGEDGFEINCSGEDAETLARKLLSDTKVKPIGLGARDSLRLEAGLCLYGNDIDEHTTPIEANLSWTIGKRRRNEANFVGANVICCQLADKNIVSRKRIGWITNGPPIRRGETILDINGNKIGITSSGIFAPTVNKPIGMAYIQNPYAKNGDTLFVKNKRGKIQKITVTKMPFISSNYFRN